MRFGELMRRGTERGGEVVDLRAGDGDGPEIRRVCEDSRKVKEGDLFVARGGSKTSGAKFVAEAVKKGAVAVVREEMGNAEGEMRDEEVAFAGVKDANLVCALLAQEVAGTPTRRVSPRLWRSNRRKW